MLLIMECKAQLSLIILYIDCFSATGKHTGMFFYFRRQKKKTRPVRALQVHSVPFRVSLRSPSSPVNPGGSCHFSSSLKTVCYQNYHLLIILFLSYLHPLFSLFNTFPLKFPATLIPTINNTKKRNLRNIKSLLISIVSSDNRQGKIWKVIRRPILVKCNQRKEACDKHAI